MRSIQSFLGCYTTPRFRASVLGLAFTSGCAVVSGAYVLTGSISDFDWISASVLVAVTTALFRYLLLMVLRDRLVSVEDLVILPPTLRAAVQARLANAMATPLDWDSLREIGDKQAMESYDEMLRQQAQAEASKQRETLEAAAAKLNKQRTAMYRQVEKGSPEPEGQL